jgi:hypothetical protein
MTQKKNEMPKQEMIVIFMSNDSKMRKDYLCVNDTISKEREKIGGVHSSQVAFFLTE